MKSAIMNNLSNTLLNTNLSAVKITDENLLNSTYVVGNDDTDDDNDDDWEHLIPALKEALGVTTATTTTISQNERGCDYYGFDDDFYNMEALTQDALYEFDFDETDVACLLD